MTRFRMEWIWIRDLDMGESVQLITFKKVEAALHSFGAHKAAGPDGIKPIVLRHLKKHFLVYKRASL